MSHTPHDLSEEFPEEAQKISRLKGMDAHFARLVERYDAVNHEIHLAESQVQPTDDFHAAELRKTRLALLDEIARLLRETAD